MTTSIYNHQNHGTAADLKSANEKIAAAKEATPVDVRGLFKSSIRYDRPSKSYDWAWILYDYR